MRTDLEGAVQRGTAASIKDALANAGWHIGGKTGTGPGRCGDQCDGWFAGLLSDQLNARYVILVFIRGKGLGGGRAARPAASMAEYLAVHGVRSEPRLSFYNPAQEEREQLALVVSGSH